HRGVMANTLLDGLHDLMSGRNQSHLGRSQYVSSTAVDLAHGTIGARRDVLADAGHSDSGIVAQLRCGSPVFVSGHPAHGADRRENLLDGRPGRTVAR